MMSIDFSDGINNALELNIVSSAELADDMIVKLKEYVDNHINPNNVNADFSDLLDYDCMRVKREIEKYIRSKGSHYVLY